ncbi:hypothetical protein LCI18_010935 [Fusarium solani-melongenae]|uniref:Uncharacterized protein n=1 Tax=Fusarium solani subsp. cucurbitae TaxID=2747967 RepID=A0ACD3ZFX1_FUSSC|nr:hypothetical protein LCI18_010935 [Fusarium solani-melongenae]
MNLGAKVKEILHSGDSEDAARGDVDRNTPGSFPVDDMAPAESQKHTSTSHEHNKLHKPNDPRGWSEDDARARGHGYTDSGVGLTEPHDTQTNTREVASEKPAEPIQRTDDYTTDSRISDNTSPTSQEPVGDTAAPSQKEHPYWGDLPRGAGVYNTIAGHGSPEDDTQRHRAIHSGEANPTATSSQATTAAPVGAQPLDFASQGTDPYSTQQDTRETTHERALGSRFNEGLGGAAAAGIAGAGAYGLGKDRGTDDRETPSQLGGASTTANPYDAQRATPPSQHNTAAATNIPQQETLPETTDLYSSQRDTQHVPEQSTRDSHFKEGLAGAAVVGTAGAGAYELNKQRQADETPKKTEEVAKPDPEEKKHRSFPLISRSHKDDTKEVKEEKHTKEPKPERESKLGGLFHRGAKDETEPAAEEEPAKDKHHGAMAGTALAAAGAGGAAYAATRDRDGDKKVQEDTTTSRYQEPTATWGADQYSNTGLGATASDTYQQPATVQGTRQYSSTDYDPNTAYGAQTTQPSVRFAGDQPTQSYHQEGSNRDGKFAAGAGAGLGAGALASHQLGKKHENTPTTTQDTERGFQPQTTQSYQPAQSYGTTESYGTTQSYESTQSYQQEGTHRDGKLAAGTAAGLGAGALASHELGRKHENTPATTQETERGYQPQSTEPHTTTTTGSTAIPAYDTSRNEPVTESDNFAERSTEPTLSITQKANEGKYNTLASGTPSGIRVEDDTKDRAAQREHVGTLSSEDKHRGAGGAAGLGAAAGLGTAAALSRKDDEKKEEPIEREDVPESKVGPEAERSVEPQPDEKPAAVSFAPQTGSSKPVIHHCQKCGEANDISQYFTSDASDRI